MYTLRYTQVCSLPPYVHPEVLHTQGSYREACTQELHTQGGYREAYIPPWYTQGGYREAYIPLLIHPGRLQGGVYTTLYTPREARRLSRGSL